MMQARVENNDPTGYSYIIAMTMLFWLYCSSSNYVPMYVYIKGYKENRTLHV